MVIRRTYDHLISIMGFPILVRWHIYIESGPCSQVTPHYTALFCAIIFHMDHSKGDNRVLQRLVMRLNWLVMHFVPCMLTRFFIMISNVININKIVPIEPLFHITWHIQWFKNDYLLLHVQGHHSVECHLRFTLSNLIMTISKNTTTNYFAYSRLVS